jgi:tRNA G18 (ribose-2'-O)-methylase SpoU
MSKDEAETLGLKVYSQQEVDMLIANGGKDVDRLLMHGINNLARVLITHAHREEETLAVMGSATAVKLRTEWVDAQIAAQVASTRMKTKVIESSLLWAAGVFLLFLANSMWDSIVRMVYTTPVPGVGK